MTLTKYFNRPLTTIFDDLFDNSLTTNTGFYPKANVWEDKNSYHIELELPGIDKKDVHLEVKDNLLIVKGERKHKAEHKEDGYFHYESNYGTFERSWVIDPVDSEKISAEEKNGILRIDLPKREELKKRDAVKQISIN